MKSAAATIHTLMATSASSKVSMAPVYINSQHSVNACTKQTQSSYDDAVNAHHRQNGAPTATEGAAKAHVIQPTLAEMLTGAKEHSMANRVMGECSCAPRTWTCCQGFPRCASG